MDSYPPELIKAYLRGQFTNLTSGTIYHQFDRRLNNCTDEEQAGEPLYIGMDFNVGKMAAIVHVFAWEPRAVRELMKVYDTPAMIKRIRKSSGAMKEGVMSPHVRFISIQMLPAIHVSRIMPAPRISLSLSRPDSVWW
jgi:hypothetical protein